MEYYKIWIDTTYPIDTNKFSNFYDLGNATKIVFPGELENISDGAKKLIEGIANEMYIPERRVNEILNLSKEVIVDLVSNESALKSIIKIYFKFLVPTLKMLNTKLLNIKVVEPNRYYDVLNFGIPFIGKDEANPLLEGILDNSKVDSLTSELKNLIGWSTYRGNGPYDNGQFEAFDFFTKMFYRLPNDIKVPNFLNGNHYIS